MKSQRIARVIGFYLSTTALKNVVPIDQVNAEMFLLDWGKVCSAGGTRLTDWSSGDWTQRTPPNIRWDISVWIEAVDKHTDITSIELCLPLYCLCPRVTCVSVSIHRWLHSGLQDSISRQVVGGEEHFLRQERRLQRPVSYRHAECLS